MNELLTILLQAEQQEGGSAWSGMIMIVAMIVIFYFFMIRPQSKKQKEIKKAREAMKKGDKVVTIGGIYGRVKEIKDNYIMLEVAQGITIKVDKSGVNPDPTADVKAAPEQKNSKKEAETAANAPEGELEAGIDLEKAAGKVAKQN